MTAFRYRRAYAILNKRIAAGELPRGNYRFSKQGMKSVTAFLKGASLTSAQARTLDAIVNVCTYTPTARAA